MEPETEPLAFTLAELLLLELFMVEPVLPPWVVDRFIELELLEGSETLEEERMLPVVELEGVVDELEVVFRS